MMRDIIIDFVQIFKVAIITSSICFAGIIRTLLHYSTYSTCCIKATMHSIRYFNSRKNQVAFFPD